MANVIKFHSNTKESSHLIMSNGLTDVFIDVLALSGSQIAHTVDEKRLIVWLSEKDQSKVGGGTIGFDICEMPWNAETFAENKLFLITVVEHAKKKAGWEYLDYSPNETLLFPCLDDFAALLSSMHLADIQPDALTEWLDAAEASDPVSCGFPTCPRHHTLLTLFGCHLCNN